VLAALGPSVEHVILIGDHEQLRPKVDQYALALDSRQGYDLDKSLFERLIYDQRAPHVTLSTQWRMRPAIADLTRLIYPRLGDAPKVRAYPEVPGLRHPLFFWDHDDKEAGAADKT
jgi:superfamily I DNA and/or RNA helicase